MAAGPITQIADVIVPQIFTPYAQQLTEKKSRLIASGAVARSPQLDQLLAGGGLTFNVPSWKDLDDDADRVPTETASSQYSGGTVDPTPAKTGTSQEVAVRLMRNQSWSAAQLAAALAGADPMRSIAERVAAYWARRAQAAFVATMTGVFADNAAAPGGTEHVQNDMTVDIKGGSFVDGVTNFSAEAFIDACTTMGDSAEDIRMVMVHSVVYARMQKNNLIDFMPDSDGKVVIPTFLGREVIVDDAMPVTSGVYESWLFGNGAVQWGITDDAMPTEVDRIPGAGNGGGQNTLYSRVVWAMHPVGNRYAGTAPSGGPTNAATANNLAAAASWQRVFPERKQIKIARLITREA